MVTDQEIARCVEALLRQSESSGMVTSVNVNGVVQQLEAKLGLDLSHKAGFIRDQINLLLRAPAPASREHFAFQQQQQLQMQQQFFHHHPQQLLQHHQIPASPFTHLPSQHELSFRSAPAMGMQPQYMLQGQQLVQPETQLPQAAVPPTIGEKEGQGARRGKTSAKGSAASVARKRGGPGGLSKVCGVSPALQAIVGEPTMSRTEIVKQLWAYIRKNNLQDPNNKRKIICNDELRLVFETDSTDMFKMNKLLAKHIIPLQPSKEPRPDKKKLKVSDVSATAETEANQYAVVISNELANFFGIGSREILQTEAVKRVWDYINMYQLKDPLNPKMIHCDAKLQELFGCKSLSALGVSEMLARHMFKKT